MTMRFALLPILCLLTTLVSAQHDSLLMEGEIYVKLSDTSSIDLVDYDQSSPALNAILSLYNVDSIARPFPGLSAGLNATYRIYFDSDKRAELITALSALSFVDYAEPAPVYYTTGFVPNDQHVSQWYLNVIGADDAWDIEKGDNSVVVAIVDNGVLLSHEDLTANKWRNSGEIAGNGFDDDLNGYTDDVYGYDVADNDGNPNPPSGITTSSPFVHGTLCAGAAAASTNNNVGIASLGFNIRFMSVKCSPDNADDEGKTIRAGYDGLYYAIRQRADVICLSWGGTGSNFLTGESIVNSAVNAGITVVAAAGNSNTDEKFYPAAYNAVIAVGATDQNDKRATFSNYGNYIDVMAPGVSIYTTNAGATNAYSSAGGTSLSCPIVGGLCGLLISQNASLSPSEVKSRITQNADNIDAINPDYAGALGAGRINAAASLGGTAQSPGVMQQFIIPNPLVVGRSYRFKSDLEFSKVSLVDLMGVEVGHLDLSMNREFQIPNDFKSGVYLIQFVHNNRKQIKRVMIVTP